MTNRFVDPYTRTELLKDADGNLYYKKGNSTVFYENYEGCYDFCLPDPELQRERDHYDKEYSNKEIEKLNPEDMRNEWYDNMNPWRITLLDSLGDLSGKKILLIGNGDTTREIYFAMLGANVIYTDLSLEAVKRRKQQVELSQLDLMENGSIEFHAVDALHLPFPDDSFDIIYGSAFVHHLDDQDQFLSEVCRCLKVNGICRFIDGAHSPVWRFLMQTVLWPLKMYSYWRNPRSPGDLRADSRGGYTREGLHLLMKKHKFRGMFFYREWFFFRIVSRHYGKLVNYDRSAIDKAKPLFQFLKLIDTCLAKTWFMKKNGLMLVWGFEK